jgi:hypothetical protein
VMKSSLLALVVIAFACSLHANPAQAQRVFVSATGLDGNPCTFASPCRTFQHAHDVAPSGGEIDVLDPAGYGALTITKAISIQGHGFAGIAAVSGDAITVNAGATDKINLRGLLIDGVGTGNNGVTFTAGATLDVQECLVRNFKGNGILFQPSGTSTLFVSDGRIAANGGDGIAVLGGGAIGAINRVTIENNVLFGLHFGNGSPTTVSLTVSDSTISNNGAGVALVGSANSATTMLRDVVVSDNTTDGVLANGSSATIRLTRSTITGNDNGLRTVSSGKIISFGDNSVAGNVVDGAPTSIILLK